MGRNKTNISRNFFAYNKTENRSICNICNTALKGDHAANLERHLKRHHNKEFLNVQQHKKIKLDIKDESLPSGSGLENRSQTRPEFLKVKLNKETIIKAVVELVTVNGCSFELLDSSGFKRILNPIFDALDNNFSLNSENIKPFISETTLEMLTQISAAIEKRMISIKIDIITQLNRTIVGIHAQLIKEGKINVFTLGMMELNDKNIGLYIKNTMGEILGKYNIDIRQIYSIIIDKGANMTSLGSEIESIETENQTTDFEESPCLDSNFIFNNLIGLKCVALLLQSVIKDFISIADLNDFLFEARELVKKLQIPSVTLKSLNANFRRPVLDASTQWSTTYNMLRALLECKDVCSSLAEDNSNYYFAENKWAKLNLIVDTLQPLTEAILKLQTEYLTLSDFYGIWVQCKIKVRNLKNVFADILYNELSNREALLLQNDSVIGAIYLDPRYQILLSTTQKLEAVQHLTNIWNNLQHLEEPIVKEEVQSSGDENVDDLEDFLRSKEMAMEARKSSGSKNVDIELILNSFGKIQRLNTKKPILEFWEENKGIYPHLYKIAVVVLATPATQISVERALSSLKFILQDNRNNLDRNTLEDMLIIRNNCHLFHNK